MIPRPVQRLSLRSITGWAIFAVLALGACNLFQPGPEAQPTLPVIDVLPGTVWYLTAIGPVDNPVPSVPGHLVTLEFRPDNNTGGTAGCNSYAGNYETQDGTITFRDIVSTLIACEDAALMDQEARYLAALNTAGGLAITNGQLFIFYGEAQVLMFSVSPPIAFQSSSTPTAPAPATATPPSPSPSSTSTAPPTATPLPPPSSTSTAPPTATPLPLPSSTPSSTPPPTPTPNASAERIQFETGKISGTVSGDLAPAGSDLYVLYALKGQTMIVDLDFDSGEAILVIWGANGVVLLTDHAEASSFTGVLPASQDYYILVKAHPNSGADYALTVVIPPLPTPAAQRISFDPGAPSGEVEGDLPASGLDLYVLRVLDGQTMTVELDFDSGEAILVIWGADGTVLLTDHTEESGFEGEIPSTQDYFILVKAHSEDGADYTMTITIPPLD